MYARSATWRRRATLVIVALILLQLLLGTGASYAAPPRQIWHRVSWGENLTLIAWRYGTSIWAIAQANGISNINRIYAGQWLRIPTQWEEPEPPAPTYYIVQSGDTLGETAWRFGRTVWAIANANGIWNIQLIYIGQRLIIP